MSGGYWEAWADEAAKGRLSSAWESLARATRASGALYAEVEASPGARAALEGTHFLKGGCAADPSNRFHMGASVELGCERDFEREAAFALRGADPAACDQGFLTRAGDELAGSYAEAAAWVRRCHSEALGILGERGFGGLAERFPVG